jgi:hypothetical protein
MTKGTKTYVARWWGGDVKRKRTFGDLEGS